MSNLLFIRLYQKRVWRDTLSLSFDSKVKTSLLLKKYNRNSKKNLTPETQI